MTDRRNFLISAALLSASACSGPIRATRQGKPGLNTAIPPDGLNLNAMMQPVQATSVLQDPDWFIWGGGMVRTADGMCHGFFARWPRKAGFNAWVTHSEIIRATSPDPLGPWTMIGPVFDRRAGFWDADNLKQLEERMLVALSGEETERLQIAIGAHWRERTHA